MHYYKATNEATVLSFHKITCPVCKAKKQVPSDTVYKIDGKIFCSYSCLQKYKRKNGLEYSNGWSTDLKLCRKRVKTCRDKYNSYYSKYLSDPANAKRYVGAIKRWAEALDEAIGCLEFMEGCKSES